MKQLWKVHCMEDQFPGMWLRWFKHQCAAVGWFSKDGYKMVGKPKSRGWSRARNALLEMKKGDFVIVSLSGHRVGRLGEITDVSVSDDPREWEPLVPISPYYPDGDMGRRIRVRWDMTTGPDDRDMVVALPQDCRFSGGELLPTISKVSHHTIARLKAVMDDPSNWVGLLSHFDYERALSGYIAAYPHHLEDGLQQHPDEKLRERVFKDGTRSDVLLIDRDDCPVVVECKQNAPSLANVRQLLGYMDLLKRERKLKKQPRGILVHGGSLNLSKEIRDKASKRNVTVMRYQLKVDFARCG